MTLLVSGMMALTHLYAGWRLAKTTKSLKTRKIIRWLSVGVLSSFYLLPVAGLLLYTANGYLNVLELPKPVTYWFWFGFVFSVQLLNGVIVLDLLKIIFHWRGRWNTYSVNKIYVRMLLLLAVVLLIYTGAKMYQDTARIKTKTRTLVLRDLPSDLEGLRIVHISDIQGDQYTGQEEITRYVKEVNNQNPHLVIFTGDLISYGTDFIDMAARGLSEIKSAYGTWAVVGDHDYWAGLNHVEPALESSGIPLLRDENKIIPVGKDSVLLTGITQVYSKQAQPDEVKRLTSASPAVPIKILASHQVSDVLLGEARKNGYDLFLAGHTHGGQVRVPFFGMTFSASDMETDFVSGVYEVGNLLVNINNGLGFTLAPVRYNAPPVVTVIELRKK